MSKKEKKEKGKLSPARIIIIMLALVILSYAAYRLYLILNDYRNKFTSVNAKEADKNTPPDTWPKYEDAEPPLHPDWDALKKINKDIVGWIYVDAEPTISYPICWRKDDDSYYLHRTFEGKYLYAGSIFLEGYNNPDFADPLSIVYGHNMQNGSMFAKLKSLLNQDVYDANPYFWILTPQGDYRYHIFSALQTPAKSGVFTLFSESGGDFLEYEKSMQKSSAVKNDVPLFDDDKDVLLSTCTSSGADRTVVLGRCVSSKQPEPTKDKDGNPRPSVRTTKDRVIITPTPKPTPKPKVQETVENLFHFEF